MEEDDAAGGGGRTGRTDWRTASFDGARREQLRRWAELPLERILLAIEEMRELSGELGHPPEHREHRKGEQ